MRLVIKNGLVVTPTDDGADQMRADIVIEGAFITSVAPTNSTETKETDRVLDASKRVIIPGLVNAHAHTAELFAKGRAKALPMNLAYLKSTGMVVAPMQEPATSDEIYARTVLAGIELVKRGVTTVVDDVLHVPDLSKDSVLAVMKAYRDVGLRARVTAMLINRPWFEFIPFAKEAMPPALLARFSDIGFPSEEETLTWCRAILEETRSDGAPVQLILSPCGPERCTPQLLLGVRALSREYCLPVPLHVQEDLINAVSGHLYYGGTHLGYLDTLGCLDERTVLIHAVWLTDEDIRRLADRGAAVVHNPVSNMKLGSGIARVRDLLDARVRVGLGCDGFSCNDSQNMFEAMKVAALLQNVTTPAYEQWLSPEEVFRMATEGGAAAYLMEGEVGRIAPGRKADLVLLDLDSLTFRPLNDALQQIIYCEDGGSVDTVIIDGKVVVEGHRLLTVDEDEAARDALAWHARFLARGQAGWQLAAQLEPYLRQAYMRSVEYMSRLEVMPICNRPRLSTDDS